MMGKIMCRIKKIISMVMLCALFTQTGYPMKKKAPQSTKFVGPVLPGEWGYNQPNAANEFLKHAPAKFKAGMDAVDNALKGGNISTLASALNAIATPKANSTINVNTNRAGEQINPKFPDYFEKIRMIVDNNVKDVDTLKNLQKAVENFVNTFVHYTTDGAAGFKAPHLVAEYRSTMQKFNQKSKTIQLAYNSGSGSTGGTTDTTKMSKLENQLKKLSEQLKSEKNKNKNLKKRITNLTNNLKKLSEKLKEVQTENKNLKKLKSLEK